MQLEVRPCKSCSKHYFSEGRDLWSFILPLSEITCQIITVELFVKNRTYLPPFSLTCLGEVGRVESGFTACG